MKPRLTERDLKRQLTELTGRFPKLADDQLFVLWFLRAYVTEDEQEAAKALSGGAGDKNVDALYVDDDARLIFVVQGKLRRHLGQKAESRNDVLGFAQLAVLLWGDAKEFLEFCKRLEPKLAEAAAAARDRLKKRKYELRLYYVSMGRCSAGLLDEAVHVARTADGRSEFEFFDGSRVLTILSDYLDGVAPPVPTLDLEMEAGHGVRGGVLQRYDLKTDIESWVFSMTGKCVAGLFERAGVRLFARNVRGFLGSTEINQGIERTITAEPEHFWYYNNGVTVICDDAQRVSRSGRDVLRVSNPQVINGQQTTRALARQADSALNAGVLVRVIRVPRNGRGGSSDRFETLVSRIVAATNHQNEIRPSDLMSNDRRQVEIERALRKLDYYYMRKRQTKGEARRGAGGHHRFVVKKEEVAQAVAACDLDPVIVREGKEGLFEDEFYHHIFPTDDATYYLTRYWLMRVVSSGARGYPERAYAKWLVLHFMWARLAPRLRARVGATFFRSECEKNGSSLNPLDRAVAAVFQGALRFYRARRGKGAKATDVSTFFKHRRLDEAFERFWISSANRSRSSFRRAWRQFEDAMVTGAEAEG